MYEIIFIINKPCGILLLWKNFFPVNILLIFGDGSLYHDAIRDATKNDLPQSQKITPRKRKSVFIKGKENGKIRMKVSVIDILYYCSMCMY